MSLKEPPTALPIALHSASGTVAVTNTRPDAIPELKGVLGASRIDMVALTPAAGLMDWRASVLPKVLAASGSALAALTICPSELENTEPIILPSLRSDASLRRRAGSGGATSRGTGLRSSMALASMTPPLPSSAA